MINLNFDEPVSLRPRPRRSPVGRVWLARCGLLAIYGSMVGTLLALAGLWKPSTMIARLEQAVAANPQPAPPPVPAPPPPSPIRPGGWGQPTVPGGSRLGTAGPRPGEAPSPLRVVRQDPDPSTKAAAPATSGSLRDAREDPPVPPGPPPADDPAAVLRARGLSAMGSRYVLADVEASAVVGLKRIAPLIDRIEELHQVWAENEAIKARAQELDDMRLRWRGTIDAIKIQLAGPIPGSAREQQAIRDELNQREKALSIELVEINVQLQTAKKRIGTLLDVQQNQQQFEMACTAFVEAKNELQPIVYQVQTAYREVKADDQVMAALRSLRELKKVQLEIAPSEVFSKGVTRVARTEKQIPPRTGSRRR